MSRILPYPLLTLFLILMWLLLNGPSPGHLVLGTILAMLVSLVMRILQPEPVRIRNPVAIVRLAYIVLVDIIRSNIAVGRIVLFREPNRRSDFVHLPLQMRSPYGLATLAIIITATPGTLWVQHDAERNMLLIHVLDLIDEEEWIELLKNRYERLLMDIFE